MKKNGKYCSNKGLNLKPLAILLALTLLVGCAVGGTLAWLTAQTPEVTNTFTVGDINITLTETDAENNAKNYDFVPGDTLSKDPKVTVLGGSEKCYLFIKVNETNNINVTKPGGSTEKAMQYSVDNAIWEEVPGQTGYWYCIVNESSTDTVKTILTNNQVKVSPYVTKGSALETSKFTLSFDASAVQYDNVDSVADAFAQAIWA